MKWRAYPHMTIPEELCAHGLQFFYWLIGFYVVSMFVMVYVFADGGEGIDLWWPFAYWCMVYGVRQLLLLQAHLRKSAMPEVFGVRKSL